MKIKDLFSEMPVIETKRVLLRKIAVNDAQDMFEYSSNRAVNQYLSYDHQNIEEVEKYIQNKQNQYNQGECMIWGIEFKENKKYIGACGFTLWEPEHHFAEIAYTLNQSYWGKGIMSEIVARLFQFGFDQMNLNRIEAKCISGNKQSVKVMERNHMKFEGTLREQLFVKGNFEDVMIYSILKHEYEAMRLAPTQQGNIEISDR